jgi:hypothetical protein
MLQPWWITAPFFPCTFPTMLTGKEERGEEKRGGSERRKEKRRK